MPGDAVVCLGAVLERDVAGGAGLDGEQRLAAALAPAGPARPSAHPAAEPAAGADVEHFRVGHRRRLDLPGHAAQLPQLFARCPVIGPPVLSAGAHDFWTRPVLPYQRGGPGP